MSEPRHILLGIRQRWAVEILGGRKVVEIRRGTKRWKRGDWLWLYAISPVQQVIGVALVEYIVIATAHYLHTHGFNRAAALSDREYWRYAQHDGAMMSAVGITHPVELAEPLDLETLGLHAPRSAYLLLSGVGEKATERLLADRAVAAWRRDGPGGPGLHDVAAELRAMADLDS